MKIRHVKRGSNHTPYHLVEGRPNPDLSLEEQEPSPVPGKAPVEARQARKLWLEREAAPRSVGPASDSKQARNQDHEI